MKCDISVTSPRGHTHSRRARLTQARVIPANIGSPSAHFYSLKKYSSEISDVFIHPKKIHPKFQTFSFIQKIFNQDQDFIQIFFFIHLSKKSSARQAYPGVMVSQHWVIVGHPGVILGHPGVKLGHLGVILGSYWVTMGSYWVTLGLS